MTAKKNTQATPAPAVPEAPTCIIDIAMSYTNGVPDLMFSRQMARTKLHLMNPEFSKDIYDRINEAVLLAAEDGKKGIRIVWQAPLIEVVQ